MTYALIAAACADAKLSSDVYCEKNSDCLDAGMKGYVCHENLCTPKDEVSDTGNDTGNNGEGNSAGDNKNNGENDNKDHQNGPQICGNGTVEGNEICDSEDLDGKTCKSLNKGYYGGKLACVADCSEFDESGCKECDPTDSSHGCEDDRECIDYHCVATTCGNGSIDAGEQCDGYSLNNKTCADMPGYKGGTLKCSPSCKFDTSGCTVTGSTNPDPNKPGKDPVCGNGTIEGSEVCDSTNINGKTCKSLNEKFYSGVPKCANNCLEFDDSGCFECDPLDDYAHTCNDNQQCLAHQCVPKTCGNGTLDAGEACDTSDLGNKQCSDLTGYSGGTLKCAINCRYDTSECTAALGARTCTEDSDCGAGSTCESGVCKVIVLECDPMDLVNKGCPDNKVCADRKCVDPSCGDGIKNTSSEECDKNDFGENTCQTEGFASGFLKCSSTCKIDNTNCSGKS